MNFPYYKNPLPSNFKFTPEGGLATKMINDTGAASIKGTVVAASTAIDNGFKSTINQFDMIGVVYDNGVANGKECFVVYSGICQVLMEDGVASKSGDWVRASTVAGRATPSTDPQGLSALAASEHFKELGHCLETKSAGTGVLIKILIHFN